MVQKGKINVKERFSDGEIDLSMSDLEEVPVKDIAALKKTVSLDLSNNRLTALPVNFTILSFLTKLDLSKNELTELPEDFGSLSKLKYLDLYKNKLERLPLSFGQLSALKFLDLKDNALVPAIAKVAGPCVDNKGCQQCARDIVKFYRQLQEEVDSEVEMRKKARQKQLEINQQKKQEEKKKLKKDKSNKVNKETQPAKDSMNGTNNSGTSKRKSKKDQKKSKQPHESWVVHRFLLLILYLFTVSIIILWFLFALRFPPTENLVPTISDYYNIFLERLPPDYKRYGQYFGDSINILQASTRNISKQCIEVVYNSHISQGILTKVGYFADRIGSKN